MGINKPHLVAVALGNPGDEIVDMADGSADSGHSFPGTKPCLHLQLPTSLQHLKVEVEVLEVSSQHPSRPRNPNLLRLDLDLHPFRQIHGLRRQDGLHDACPFSDRSTAVLVQQDLRRPQCYLQRTACSTVQRPPGVSHEEKEPSRPPLNPKASKP